MWWVKWGWIINLRDCFKTQIIPFLTRKIRKSGTLLWQNWEAFKLGRTSWHTHDIKYHGKANRTKSYTVYNPPKERQAGTSGGKSSNMAYLKLLWVHELVLLFLLKNKDGNMHFCMDHRKLNAICIKDAYLLPHIDDSLLDTLLVLLYSPSIQKSQTLSEKLPFIVNITLSYF